MDRRARSSFRGQYIEFGQDDRLVKVKPLLEMIRNWKDYPGEEISDEMVLQLFKGGWYLEGLSSLH